MVEDEDVKVEKEVELKVVDDDVDIDGIVALGAVSGVGGCVGRFGGDGVRLGVSGLCLCACVCIDGLIGLPG